MQTVKKILNKFNKFNNRIKKELDKSFFRIEKF